MFHHNKTLSNALQNVVTFIYNAVWQTKSRVSAVFKIKTSFTQPTQTKRWETLPVAEQKATRERKHEEDDSEDQFKLLIFIFVSKPLLEKERVVNIVGVNLQPDE